MKTMNRLTIGRARDLIKRELGLSATALTAPSDMNGNPDFPWYEMFPGNQHIEVTTNDIRQGKYTDKMIALSVTHMNSSNETSEYFYSDTLEYSEIYTEWKNREVFCESMEDPENDTILHRLKCEAMDDCWAHFHVKNTQQKKLSITEILNRHESSIKKIISDNRHGKLKPDIIRSAISDCNIIMEYFSKYASGHPEDDHINFVLKLQKENLDWLKSLEQKLITGQPVQEQQNGQPGFDECPEAQDQAETTKNPHSDEILEKAAFENFEGKLLQGHDLFKIRVFDLCGNYTDPQSEVWPIDETHLDWWIKEVTQGVNNNSEKAAGFSVFQWDRINDTWTDYCPDGKNQLRYDTGRRSDGTVHEACKRELYFQGKLKIRISDLHGTFIHDTDPFDETKLNWWVDLETRHINDSHFFSGLTVFQWDSANKMWLPYRPDGIHEMIYDTGRRPDGKVLEACKKGLPQVNAQIGNQSSLPEPLADRLTAAHQELALQDKFTQEEGIEAGLDMEL